MEFQTHTLANGLRIIGVPMPAFRSVSVGLWVDSGSIYETPEENGVSHFIEHMLFKGTYRRSARQIAEEMDAVGGLLNAFTDVENTCFHTRVIAEHLPLAMDMIADLVLHSRLDPEDIEREKGVVLEEISMAEDTPDDLVFELATQAHYGLQPISQPVLGSAENVSGFTRETITGYMARRYRPQGAVLALAGGYDWKSVVALAGELFGNWQGPNEARPEISVLPHTPGVLKCEKDIEQTHICLNFPCPRDGTKETFAYGMLSSVLGGASSSRLFQTIREEKGLAYNVYISSNTTMHSGLASVYAGTSPENAREVVRLAIEQMRRLGTEGVSEKEFLQAREQMLSSLIMSLESPSSRMRYTGRRLLMKGDTMDSETLIEKIRAVRIEEVNELAKDLVNAPFSAAVVGADAQALTDEALLGKE